VFRFIIEGIDEEIMLEREVQELTLRSDDDQPSHSGRARHSVAMLRRP
jgi:hypothetical protein